MTAHVEVGFSVITDVGAGRVWRLFLASLSSEHNEDIVVHS